jgi:hypothetical protein
VCVEAWFAIAAAFSSVPPFLKIGRDPDRFLKAPAQDHATREAQWQQVEAAMRENAKTLDQTITTSSASPSHKRAAAQSAKTRASAVVCRRRRDPGRPRRRPLLGSRRYRKDRVQRPGWTVGIKLGRDKNGAYWLLDMVRGRANPGDVDRLLLNTATQVTL